MKSPALLAVLALSVLTLVVQPAHSQNLVVNTLAGDNDGSCDAGGTGPADDCSLLEALDVANANVDAGVIEFSVSGTITADDTPEILTPVTLDGTTAPGGSRSVTISRDIPQLGFRVGVLIDGVAASGSVVQGLRFSRRLLGSLGNNAGVQVDDAADVRVGGSDPAQGNAFVDTDFSIQVVGPNANNALILGNVITGNDLGEFDYAITIANAPNATVGGTGANDGNTIDAVEFGIFVDEAGASGFTIIGNSIDGAQEDAIRLTDGMTSGSVLSNTITNAREGIVLSSVSGLVIGGLGAGEGNIVTASTPISIVGTCPDVDVLGNEVTSTNNFGIRLNGVFATGVEIRGNRVTDGFVGIAVDGAPDAVVGGAGPGEGNVVTNAEFAGIRVQFTFAEGVRVLGNEITGNSEIGIYVENSPDGIIGGTGPGEGNTISGAETGVFIWDRAGDGVIQAVLGNSISGASSLGIDLTAAFPADGVTPNDGAPDADNGSNGLQNFPDITAVTPGVAIDFSLASTPSTTFRIEAFANAAPGPLGFGPGERFLGFVQVTTDGSGNAMGSIPAAGLLATEWATLTATPLDGSSPTGFGGTSEFSAAASVSGSLPTIMLSLLPDEFDENGASATLMATLSAPADGDVVITLAYSGDAQQGVNFNGPATITILDGETTGMATITAIDNNDDAPDIAFAIAVASVSGNAAAPPPTQTLPATIRDDDGMSSPPAGPAPQAIPALPWPAVVFLSLVLAGIAGRKRGALRR